MGDYATTTALDTLMVGVTFDTATTSLATQCITWAENEVNKKLSKRYDVSTWTTTTPPLIQSLTEQQALGHLWDQLSRGGTESQTRADRYFARVKENLDMLADNKLDLVDSSGNSIARKTGLGILSNTNNYTPTFAEDSSLTWKVDEDKLDDIADDRV